MTLPSEAAFLACQDIDSIVYLMYANRLHVRHIERKGLFVCLASLCQETFDDDFEDMRCENDSDAVKIGTANYNLLFKE